MTRNRKSKKDYNEQTSIQYKLKDVSLPTTAAPKKGWFIPTLMGAVVTTVFAGILYFVKRSSPIPDTPTFTPALTEGPCALDNLQVMTFKPGLMNLMAEQNSLPYPFFKDIEDPENPEPKSSSAQQNFNKAIAWLNTQPGISEFKNGKQLWDSIKNLHKRIAPDAKFPYGDEKYTYVNTEDVRFFSNSEKVESELEDFIGQEGMETLSSLENKVREIKNRFVETMDSSLSQGLEETIMLEIYQYGNLQGQIIPQNLRFTEQERALIQRFYDIKPRAKEKDLTAELDKVIEAHKTNPLRAAAIAHMIIVQKHYFYDGNGRTARAICNHILKKAKLPILIITNRKEYDRVVRKAEDNNDPSIFEKYLSEKLTSKQYQQAEDHCVQLHAFDCHKAFKYQECVRQKTPIQVLHEREEKAKKLENYRQGKQARLRAVRRGK